MSTAVLDGMTDNSAKDNTGDAINGSEVDANPNVLAKILDGTTATDLGGDGAVDFLAVRVLDLGAAAGAIQRNATVEWDPASGNMTDNSSGVGVVFKMPDDANNQDEFGALDVMCVSDATGAEKGELSLKLMPGSGTLTEAVTIQSGLTTTGVVLNLSTAEPTVVDGDVLGRIDFQAPSDTAGTDAILVAASIYAEADDTFAADNNDTDLVFAVAESETAAERMRLSYDGTATSLQLTGATNMILSDGSITDSSGAISFGNENLSTTGTLASGALTVTGSVTSDGLIVGDSEALTMGTGTDATLQFDGTNTVLATAAQLVLTPTTDTIFSNDTGVVVGYTAKLASQASVTPEFQVIGTSALTDAAMGLSLFNTSAQGPIFNFARSAHASIGGHTRLAAGDHLGNIDFSATNGTNFAVVAGIQVIAESNHDGAGDLPTAMLFKTSADGTASSTERMRIDSAGDIHIGTSAKATVSTLRGNMDAAASSPIFDLFGVWNGNDVAKISLGSSEDDTNKDDGEIRMSTAAPGGSMTQRMFLDRAGVLYVGATAQTVNAFMGVGVQIQQATGDTEILAFKSSDVGHAMTAISNADTYGSFKKAEATSGGLAIQGFKDGDGAAGHAISLQAFLGEAADDTKTTGGIGVIVLDGKVTDAGTGSQAVGANGNIVTIRTSGTTRFIFDAEGSAHADVEFVAFDAHDDLMALDQLEVLTTKKSPTLTPERYGGNAISYGRDWFEDNGIVGRDSWHYEDGGLRCMLNFSKLSMLHHGAILQLADRHLDAETRIEQLEKQVKLLAKAA